MRRPGFEPGSRPWEGRILPLDYQREHVKRETNATFKYLVAINLEQNT